MPPRIRVRLLQTPTIPSTPSTVSISSSELQLPQSKCCVRQFSQTARNDTRQRALLHRWLDGPGKVFRDPLPGSTNYMSAYDGNGKLVRLTQPDGESGAKEEEEEEDRPKDGSTLPRERATDLRPYPLNRNFLAQPVLSEALREDVYQRVKSGESVTKVSGRYRVSLERVAAVVRLKEIEKKWAEEGKPLASVYSRAVLSMLQTTKPSKFQVKHESITDIPIHAATKRQLFHPVPESRRFTRADAAALFSPSLAPIDTRMPHQELVLAEKLRLQGKSNQEIAQAKADFIDAQDRERRLAQEKRERWEKEHTTVHGGRRYDFRIREMNVEDAGSDGRGEKGLGWRYGFPHEDRKRGQVKIPTEVVA